MFVFSWLNNKYIVETGWRCFNFVFFCCVQVRRSLKNNCRTWRIRTCRNFCPVNNSRTQHNNNPSSCVTTSYSASHPDHYYYNNNIIIYLNNNTQHNNKNYGYDGLYIIVCVVWSVRVRVGEAKTRLSLPPPLELYYNRDVSQCVVWRLNQYILYYYY